jgi:hypothetical protein
MNLPMPNHLAILPVLVFSFMAAPLQVRGQSVMKLKFMVIVIFQTLPSLSFPPALCLSQNPTCA